MELKGPGEGAGGPIDGEEGQGETGWIASDSLFPFEPWPVSEGAVHYIENDDASSEDETINEPLATDRRASSPTERSQQDDYLEDDEDEQPPGEGEKRPPLPDPGRIEPGSTVEDVLNLVPPHIREARKPARRGGGMRYPDPDRPGDQLIIEPGEPTSSNVHGGPYVKISIRGTVVRIPLKGNPTL